MLVRCSGCQTTLRVDETKFSSALIKVTCPKCKKAGTYRNPALAKKDSAAPAAPPKPDAAPPKPAPPKPAAADEPAPLPPPPAPSQEEIDPFGDDDPEGLGGDIPLPPNEPDPEEELTRDLEEAPREPAREIDLGDMEEDWGSAPDEVDRSMFDTSGSQPLHEEEDDRHGDTTIPDFARHADERLHRRDPAPEPPPPPDDMLEDEYGETQPFEYREREPGTTGDMPEDTRGTVDPGDDLPLPEIGSMDDLADEPLPPPEETTSISDDIPEGSIPPDDEDEELDIEEPPPPPPEISLDGVDADEEFELEPEDVTREQAPGSGEVSDEFKVDRMSDAMFMEEAAYDDGGVELGDEESELEIDDSRPMPTAEPTPPPTEPEVTLYDVRSEDLFESGLTLEQLKEGALLGRFPPEATVVLPDGREVVAEDIKEIAEFFPGRGVVGRTVPRKVHETNAIYRGMTNGFLIGLIVGVFTVVSALLQTGLTTSMLGWGLGMTLHFLGNGAAFAVMGAFLGFLYDNFPGAWDFWPGIMFCGIGVALTGLIVNLLAMLLSFNFGIDGWRFVLGGNGLVGDLVRGTLGGFVMLWIYNAWLKGGEVLARTAPLEAGQKKLGTVLVVTIGIILIFSVIGQTVVLRGLKAKRATFENMGKLTVEAVDLEEPPPTEEEWVSPEEELMRGVQAQLERDLDIRVSSVVHEDTPNNPDDFLITGRAQNRTREEQEWVVRVIIYDKNREPIGAKYVVNGVEQLLNSDWNTVAVGNAYPEGYDTGSDMMLGPGDRSTFHVTFFGMAGKIFDYDAVAVTPESYWDSQ